MPCPPTLAMSPAAFTIAPRTPLARNAPSARCADQYLVGWSRDFITVLAPSTSSPTAMPDLQRFRP